MSENLYFHHGQMPSEEVYVSSMWFPLDHLPLGRNGGQKCIEQLVKDFLSAHFLKIMIFFSW